MACDEAELGEEEFAEKMKNQQKLQEQVNVLTSDSFLVVVYCVHY